MLNQRGLIHLDFSDLTNLVGHSDGTCTIACATAEGEDACNAVAAAMLEAPLLEGGSVLSSAAALMISIRGGADLSLDDIEELVKKLSSRSREDVKIAVGVNVDGTLGDRVEVMLVTSELWVRSKMPDRTVASVAATAAK